MSTPTSLLVTLDLSITRRQALHLLRSTDTETRSKEFALATKFSCLSLQDISRHLPPQGQNPGPWTLQLHHWTQALGSPPFLQLCVQGIEGTEPFDP
ncbi:hypothetical protein Y1Q_0001953 [Alligator mississippiensis]|uniref:Uncharacterized protein n=1 Tax=Alligator mississippiensis TaxID=8496 RepID=A0A151PGI8_ALLMI|nr:hypothetical protein Y1Q_0001953 [Alligator mississippiensis]